MSQLGSPQWRNREAASDGVAVYDLGQIAASQEKVL